MTARRLLMLLGSAAAWLTFDHYLGARRVSRAAAANLRNRARTMHQTYPIQSGETVFLGDSITSDGDWTAAFPNLRTRNRGIGWDTTEDLLARLDDSLGGPPATVVVMIGTNDLPLGFPHAKTVRNISLILDHVSTVAPDSKLVVQSVLPRTDRYHPLIAPLNVALARICDERSLTFVDHTNRLSDSDGQLEPDCHDDGIHLNGEGQRRLVEGLRPYLGETASP